MRREDPGEPSRFVDFVLGSDDVSRLRFGISPGHELCAGVTALQSPGSRPLQWGWLRTVAGRLPRESWDLLTTVIAPHGYFPDFLTSTPSWDLTPRDELAALRRVPPERVAHELSKVMLRATGARRDRLRAMIDAPQDARQRIADAWEVAWEAVLSPSWTQVRRLLEADVARRARQLAEGGVAEMVAQLHERVTWVNGRVRVRLQHWSERIECQGTGLLLVPSVLGSPWCAVVTEPPAAPALFYPVWGLTEAWSRDGAVKSCALAALFGAGRARVLLALDAPSSTSEVARACSLAASTASHHLAVLRDAQLVDSRRAGLSILHVRTALGDSLVHA